LVVGGLLTLSFVRVMTAPKGFDVAHVVTQDVSMSGPRFNDTVRHRFVDDAVPRLAAMPGVRAVGVTSQLPLRGEAWTCSLRDSAHPEKQDSIVANFRFVNEQYFAALGIGFRSGRSFEAVDRTRHVAVVSEAAARYLWPGQDAVGKRVNGCGAD